MNLRLMRYTNSWYAVEENIIKLFSLFNRNTKLIYSHNTISIESAMHHRAFCYPEFSNISYGITGTKRAPFHAGSIAFVPLDEYEDIKCSTYTIKQFIDDEIDCYTEHIDLKSKFYINMEKLYEGVLFISS